MNSLEHSSLRFTLSFLLFFFSSITHAFIGDSPWFTGPFVARNAVSAGKGTVLYTYSMNSLSGDSFFNTKGGIDIDNSYPFNSINIQPTIAYGLTDKVDITWVPSYNSNRTVHVTGYGLGDTLVYLGISLLQQTPSNHIPDFRLTLGELFPNGRFDQLNAAKGLNDATGLGSYQQTLGLNFAYLSLLPKNLYLNSHLSILLTYSNSLVINGFSTYGGNEFTHGRMKPANLVLLDFAEELSLNQRWALGLELYYIYGGSDNFTGHLGRESSKANFFPSSNNLPSLFKKKNVVGNSHRDAFSVIPSVEFNFNENFGVLVGYWFMLAGTSYPISNGPLLSFNASWA